MLLLWEEALDHTDSVWKPLSSSHPSALKPPPQCFQWRTPFSPLSSQAQEVSHEKFPNPDTPPYPNTTIQTSFPHPKHSSQPEIEHAHLNFAIHSLTIGNNTIHPPPQHLLIPLYHLRTTLCQMAQSLTPILSQHRIQSLTLFLFKLPLFQHKMAPAPKTKTPTKPI